jgi:predicted deacylase
MVDLVDALAFPKIEDFPLLSRNRLRLRVAAGMDGNEIALPVEVIVGRSHSPRVVLVSGVHGDELEGILALHRLCRELVPQDLNGTVVVIPVANPVALSAGSRLIPIDASDLNRAFPGEVDGSFSARLAAAIFTVVRGSAFLYTLHSWGSRGTVTPYVEFPLGDDPISRRSFQMAQLLGLDLLRAIQWHPGLLVASAVRAGTPAIEAEIGGQAVSTAEGNELCQKTLLNLLRALHILTGSPASVRPIHVVRHIDLRSDVGGLLIPNVALRQPVRKGQRLAMVTDLLGDQICEITAPSDGLVAAYRSFNAIHPGDTALTMFIAVETVTG